jgi:hypothetical protein
MFAFSSLTGQIILTKPLIDSLVYETVTKSKNPHFADLDVIKFTQYSDRGKEMVISKTIISNRIDIPSNSHIYVSNGYIVLLRFNNIYLHSGLLEIMIDRTDDRFVKTLDSIKFPRIAKSGIVYERLFLDVITIKKRCFTSNQYKLTFEKIFPASLAPKELWPVESFTDGQYMVDPPYEFIYNSKGEMLEEYKELIIPQKPKTIKLRKMH